MVVVVVGMMMVRGRRGWGWMMMDTTGRAWGRGWRSGRLVVSSCGNIIGTGLSSSCEIVILMVVTGWWGFGRGVMGWWSTWSSYGKKRSVFCWEIW